LWTGRTPGNLFDLQLAAGLTGLPYPLGHGPLVSQVLGVHLPKGETRTEWRNRPLTPAQIRYAFDDVRYLLPAWQRLAAPGGEAGGRGAGRSAPGWRPTPCRKTGPARGSGASCAASVRWTGAAWRWCAPCTPGGRRRPPAATGPCATSSATT